MTSTGGDGVQHRFLYPTVDTSNISGAGANLHTAVLKSVERNTTTLVRYFKLQLPQETRDKKGLEEVIHTSSNVCK